MKGRSIHIACLVLALFGGGWTLLGQQVSDDVILNSPLFRERFYLQTDRSLYSAGEPVCIRVFNLSHALLKENSWSHVLYLEVINTDSKPVAAATFKLEQDGGSGTVLLPDTVSTGEYYLRAYTRWMLNFPPTDYIYVPLAIANPHRLNLSDPEAGDSATVGSRFPPEEGPVLSELAKLEGQGLYIEPDRELYPRRTQAVIRIQTGENLKLDGDLAVAIARKELIGAGSGCYSGRLPGNRRISGPMRYLPESRGRNIEGMIRSVEDGQPVTDAVVNVTLLGTDPDYIRLVSDRNGYIQFTIPPGKTARNALTNIEESSGLACRLYLMDPFSTEFLSGSVPRTGYFPHRLKVIEEMMIYSQLRQAFGLSAKPQGTPSDTAFGIPFYGAGEYVYRPADYISIPNLEEFLFELVPQVIIKERRGGYLVTMLDDQGFPLEAPPLILLDHVAVKDLNALFQADPRFIDRIDIINTHYVRGGNYYGGIISMISKEGNLAGVGLPEGSTIIDLQAYQEPGSDHMQEQGPSALNENIPDLRTLLYWNPREKVPEGGQTTIEFVTPDIAGSYVATVTGMTHSGQIVQSSCTFRVE